jgi:hypothetical protein
MKKHQYILPFMILLISSCLAASVQDKSNISRIEFNAGTRAYREQLIVTPDSTIVIKEDFRINQKPVIKTRTTAPAQWTAITNSIKDIQPSEIGSLKSPTDKRTYDAATIGTIIITTNEGKSYSHEFDDENPHEKFAALMKELKKVKGTK